MYATDLGLHFQWRYLILALSASLEFHFLLRPSPSPTFSFLFPNRLTYEHIALLRQLFISISMAMSQLTPLLFPLSLSESTTSATTEERALAQALQDADRLKPLLTRLSHLTAAAEAEASALQLLELRPLLVLSSEGDPKERQRKIVKGVKEQMVKTFEDLQIKSNPSSARVWEEAVKAARARENGKVGTAPPLAPFAELPSPPTSPIMSVKGLSQSIEGKLGDALVETAHSPSPPPEVDT